MDKLIYSFQKNSYEEIRIQVKEYKGHDLVDLRIYTDVRTSNDKIPTTKGLSFNVTHFLEFKRAILELEKSLIQNNLLSPKAAEEGSSK